MNTLSFVHNYKDSESLVSNEVACKGAVYSGQLLNDSKNVYGAVVRNDCSPRSFTPYSSQYGLQGKIYTIGYRALTKIVPVSINTYLAVSQLVTALISAIVFSLFALWAFTNFSKFSGWFLVLAIGISPMIVGFGRNLYWVLPLMLLPLLLVLYYYEDSKVKPNKSYLFWVSLGVLYYIRFLCGYEYVTTLTIMSFAGIAYFLWLKQVNLGRYIREGALVLLVAGVGFFAALTTHIISLQQSAGSTSKAIDIVKSRAFARIADSEDYLSYPYKNYEFLLPDDYAITNSYLHLDDKANTHSQLWSSIVSLLNYALLPVYVLPVLAGQPLVGLAESLIVFSGFLVFLFRRREGWAGTGEITTKVQALYLATLVGFGGYLSWLILARPHSLVHAHINGILMYLPFALFGYLIISVWIERTFMVSEKVSKKRRNSKRKE
jgi:hypothetical protein